MRGAGPDLVVQTLVHPTNGWILVPLQVSTVVTIPMVLDTGSPLSSVSERTQQLLSSLGALRPLGGRRYLLERLRIEGQPIDDLVVRLSRRVSQVGASGVLGLDFLRRFTDIHFHVPTLRLILTVA